MGSPGLNPDQQHREGEAKGLGLLTKMVTLHFHECFGSHTGPESWIRMHPTHARMTIYIFKNPVCLNFFNSFYLFLACMGAGACMWRTEQPWESVLSFHYVNPRDRTKVTKLTKQVSFLTEPPRQPKTTILILSYQQSASWGLRNRNETQGELGSENCHIVFREHNRERLPTLVIYFAGSPKHRHRTYFHRDVCQQRHSQWNSARWLKCVWINNLSANFTGIILKTRRHHGKIPRAQMFNKKNIQQSLGVCSFWGLLPKVHLGAKTLKGKLQKYIQHRSSK